MYNFNFIHFIGDNMFEYNHFCLNIYGFIKIIYLDENKLEFKYKKKDLIVKGKQLKIINMIDKSLQVRGLIENIEIKYRGDSSD